MKEKNTKLPVKTDTQSPSLTELEVRIPAREAEIESARKRTMDEAAKTIELVIAQGKDLSLAKSLVTKDQWEAWLKKHFKKSIEIASGYAQLAFRFDGVKELEDESDLKKAMKIAGLLPEVESSHEQNQTENILADPIFDNLNRCIEIVNRESTIIKGWTPERRTELKARLKPIVELYNTL